MERKLAAILAADVVGYSAMMEKDEEGTLTALREHRAAVFNPAIGVHSGRIVKLMGDGTLVEFASVVDAVKCAVSIQTSLSSSDGPIKLRIGINLGDVIIDGDDIYGDGVNVAARLEGLAEPGGVCISSVAHQSLGNRSEVQFEDLGERQIKNIDRPVQVFGWAPAARNEPTATTASENTLASDKPSIAVLAFDNMSGDPEQEYFSDGVSEDIITELSRFSELFVIARNSTFAFKGQKIDVKDVAQKLGVQYVVEGSVRKAGNRIRVTAQLIDALGGGHVWADKYDRLLEDIFEVQDDVVRAIVAVLPGRIAEAGAEHARRKPTSNLSAFDFLLRGNHALARRGDGIRTAINFYEEAIERDPECAPAYAMIGIAEGMSVWDLSTYNDNPLDRAYKFAKRSLELDPGDYRSHGAFGEAARQLGQPGIAREHLTRAHELNPNSAQVLGYLAMLQAYGGEPETAIETYQGALKLDPFSVEYLRKEVPAEAYFNMRRYEDSVAVLESMLKLPIFYVHQQLAMCHAFLGNEDKFQHHLAAYRAELPESYDEMLLFESHMRICATEADAEHWREGYRRTGLDV